MTDVMVLDGESIDEVSRISGVKSDELRKLLDKAELTGHVIYVRPQRGRADFQNVSREGLLNCPGLHEYMMEGNVL